MELPSIFLNKILSEVARRNALALHLSVGNKPIMKIGGQLVPIEEENFVTSEILAKIIESILSKDELDALNKEKEITLVKIFGGSFRFRLNIFFEKSFFSLSFYYIQSTPKTIEELKLPVPITQIVKNNHGLLVIAGSFASGRTTTATALLEDVNKNTAKTIATIEDPIEYVFVSKKSIITQRQIGTDAVDYMSAIEYCLEEDVDVVYISKIKKNFEEAIVKILELASGNTLVILEMDANSSMKVMQKFINNPNITMSPEAVRYSLADVLQGIIVQKLLPSVGGGMVLAKEVLVANAAIRSLIREGKIYQMESIIQTSRQEGMINMNKSLEELATAGLIKREDYQANIV